MLKLSFSGTLWLWEQTLSDRGQFTFKDHVQTVFEGVRANDSAIVGKKNDTTAATTVFVCQELVLHDGKSASIVASSLTLHDVSVLSLTLCENSLDHGDFLFADFQFQLVFEKLDHALKSDKAKQS